MCSLTPQRPLVAFNSTAARAAFTDFNRQYNVCSRDRQKLLTVSLIKQNFALNVLFYQQRVMAAYREATPPWKTTIIVSTSLQNHDTCRMLSAQQHRIRFSDSVVSGAFIFPLSGTAFLLVDPQDLPEHFEDSGLIERIKTFVQVHRNSFLLLFAPFSGKKELEILSVIQSRFFGSNLRILPVRNNTEIVKGLLTIAKATSKPHVDSIRDRMSLARAHVLESSPVWEMLRDFL